MLCQASGLPWLSTLTANATSVCVCACVIPLMFSLLPNDTASPHGLNFVSRVGNDILVPSSLFETSFHTIPFELAHYGSGFSTLQGVYKSVPDHLNPVGVAESIALKPFKLITSTALIRKKLFMLTAIFYMD